MARNQDNVQAKTADATASGVEELIHEGSLNSGGPEYTLAKQRDEDMSPLSPPYGLRAAGNFGNLVFFAGHYLRTGNDGWLRIFVFNAATRSFLGYRDIRGDTTRRFKVITDKNGNEGFYTIIGAVKANQGESFQYPITIRFIS